MLATPSQLNPASSIAQSVCPSPFRSALVRKESFGLSGFPPASQQYFFITSMWAVTSGGIAGVAADAAKVDSMQAAGTMTNRFMMHPD
jgi:hypothetical protein